MMREKQVTDFLNAIQKSEDPILAEMYEEAVCENIPVIRRDTQSFLKTLLFLLKPKSILEAGTAVGFSACFMARYTSDDCHITTIENYAKRIPIARINFTKAGFSDRITLVEGDAGEFLSSLCKEKEKGSAQTYDLIFMDAAKGQYLNWLPYVKKLMHPGSVLLSDNVLFDGNVALSRYMVERRDRTIHKRMRDYIFALMNDGQLQTTILKTGDGLGMSIMK